MTGAVALALLLLQVPQAAPPAPASIQGFVRRTGTGEPVYKARLTLSGGPQDNSGVITPPKSTTTDKDGHFAFTNLGASRYNVAVFGNGYVRQNYGQRGDNQPGTPIVLTAGQDMKDVVVEVVPTGTITGRIYDFDNAPLPGADVILQKSGYDANGQRNLQVVQQVRTNDLGEYRLFWLTPGKYFLRVDYTGAPTPLFRNPNEYTGPLEAGYAPTYYPGTPDPSRATEIELLPAAQLSAMDLTVVPTRTYTVSGRVIISGARDANTRPFVSLRQRQPSGVTSMSMPPTTMNPDGAFEMRNIVPGAYVLTANAGSGVNALRAEKPIEVNNDMVGVVINLSPGFNVPIHITFEGQEPTGPGVRPISDIRVTLQTMNGSGGGVGILTSLDPPKIRQDGMLVMPQVFPGTYRLSLNLLPSPDYYIKAVMFGQMDVLREGFYLERTPDAPIEVVLSSNGGKIEGTVVDKDGKPQPRMQVTLIPSDRSRSDRFKIAVTDSNGRFSVRGIYPDEYKLFAWEALESNAQRDPDFIRRFEEQGKRAVIVEGTNPSVELRVIRP